MRNAAPTSTPKFPCRNGRMALSLPIHACLAPAPSDNHGLPFPRRLQSREHMVNAGRGYNWPPDRLRVRRASTWVHERARQAMEGFALIALAIAAVVIGFFLIRQSKKKGPWGIGPLTTTCPRCRTSMPALRKPTSVAEGMWGGWTYPTGGCKVGKYGQERAAP